MVVFEWILLSAIPALGFLLLFLILNRWGKKHDVMGGRQGHIWKPEDPAGWTDRD